MRRPAAPWQSTADQAAATGPRADREMMKRFRLSPMSPLIFTLTFGMLALSSALLVIGLIQNSLLLIPALLLAATYAWVWVRMRPSRFVLHPWGLEVVWPLRQCKIPRHEIADVRVVDGNTLRSEIGWSMRIGVGGLWGGFGWLWTKRRGVGQMYVSRTDHMVWLERTNGRPWLITPENTEAFVRALLLR